MLISISNVTFNVVVFFLFISLLWSVTTAIVQQRNRRRRAQLIFSFSFGDSSFSSTFLPRCVPTVLWRATHPTRPTSAALPLSATSCHRRLPSAAFASIRWVHNEKKTWSHLFIYFRRVTTDTWLPSFPPLRAARTAASRTPRPTALRTNWSSCRRRRRVTASTTSLSLYVLTIDPGRNSTPSCCSWTTRKEVDCAVELAAPLFNNTWQCRTDAFCIDERPNLKKKSPESNFFSPLFTFTCINLPVNWMLCLFPLCFLAEDRKGFSWVSLGKTNCSSLLCLQLTLLQLVQREYCLLQYS